MKKILVLLLVLLLAGCGAQPEETTAGTTEAATTQESTQAEQTGPVQTYALQAPCSGMLAMGSRLLLMTQDGSLTVFYHGKQTATLVTGTTLGDDAVLTATAQGAAYYLPESRQVVLLNPQLQETDRVTLPEQLQGSPVISLESHEVYYCVSGQVRALSLETGISRLVRSHSEQEATLTGTCFGGSVLILKAGERVSYISAQTGQLLSDSQSIEKLMTDETDYLAAYRDGTLSQWIFGTLDGTPRTLLLDGPVYEAFALGGAVHCCSEGSDLRLRLYSLDSGAGTAEVCIEGAALPTAVLALDDALWVLTQLGGEQVLCRWDPTETPADGDSSCIGTLYTADAPDTEGLAACSSRAQKLGSTYGVRIRIWQEAVKTDGGNVLTPEHHTSVISAALDALEQVLAQFPSKFLRKTVASGWVRICLVRSTGTDAPFVQYWSGGDCYLAIVCNGDEADSLVRGVSYAIDSHVLGNSRDLDDWNLLNPEGFAYTYDADTLPENAQQYLQEGSEAFVDLESMRFPQEDRSRLLAAAMTQGNEELFESPTLRTKLQALCEAIREAYSLKKFTDPLPWEQYLPGENTET